MITLHTFGPAFQLADASPFVTKAIVLLKMSGLEHRTVISDGTKAPKKKLPFIEDNGTTVPDSTFIKLHLETAHNIDFSGGYCEEELARGWVLEKMLEEYVYWLIVYARWKPDESFNKGPRRFFDQVPAIIRPLVVRMVRRGVCKNLLGQGLGRHSEAELEILAQKSFAAASTILGDKRYVLGDNLCGYDASFFAFIDAALCRHFDNPVTNTARQFANLKTYCERMREELAI